MRPYLRVDDIAAQRDLMSRSPASKVKHGLAFALVLLGLTLGACTDSEPSPPAAAPTNIWRTMQ